MSVLSALGPDDIMASIYKKYTCQLMYPIKKIWQASLECIKLSEGATQAITTPIYKGGVVRY